MWESSAQTILEELPEQDMDTWTIVLGIAALLLIFGSPFLKRYLNRKAQNFGEQAGKNFAAKRLPVALDQISTTLELQTDPATATALLNEVVAAKPKKAAAAGPNLWHVSFASRDDIHVRQSQTPTGVLLDVVKTIEFQEFPQGGNDWGKFRGRVVEAAQANGIATREGSSPHLQRVQDPNGGETLGGNPVHVWVRREG